ncbi:dynein axonemal intermediate chain 3-like [Macrosteles quadrilineatus]|uniref:dynein axonemal intermediate chain 3-like n=1 Tax=Macrosteles quadrilineatus TaxID=74068 RepID=UPI0023E276F6|nr:dynein axonemal intermediate chain 3-like [Macrosteles quadrilineatus]
MDQKAQKSSLRKDSDKSEKRTKSIRSLKTISRLDSKEEHFKPKEERKSIAKTEISKTDEASDVLDGNAHRRRTISKENGNDDYTEHRLSKLRHSRMDIERQSTASRKKGGPKSVAAHSTASMISSGSAVSLDLDVVTLMVPETAQKIAHCQIGKDLFVDKTWCMVKKKDLLEDIAIEDANSPFFHLTQKLLEYKSDELLIGYEPFASEPNQFMLCVTETGRDEVLAKLEEMKTSYLQRIQQSKEVKPRKWNSLGSEEFVDHFQIKNTRKLISLEWIGDIRKRIEKPPIFEDCDPDDMKNGYTCLVPSDKEKFELVYRKTQETGVQAVAYQAEAEVQTEPEIPTNASTQYAPETEISLPDTAVTQASIKSQDLDEFFKKYKDYLIECLEYNEVYDLYHDDYPALYVAGEQTQVQQLGTYHQYQSFTDVAAIQGKLVVSSCWHPNYTGIVAIAYANEIPCLMKELEFDSDQTDYEEEKTDGEEEGGEEPELGAGARDWLLEERREKESTGENTELFEKAVRRLKDIEAAKGVWDAKIQEETEEVRKSMDDTQETDLFANLLKYREYKEPEPEPDDSATSRKSDEHGEVEEGKGGEGEEGNEGGEEEGTQQVSEEEVSPKSSRMTFRQQLEADIEESYEGQHVTSEVSSASGADDFFIPASESSTTRTNAAHATVLSRQPSLPLRISRNTIGSISSTRKQAHHRKKQRQHTATGRTQSGREIESSTPKSSVDSSSMESKILETGKEKDPYPDSEFFDEVTDEEEIKEKQDELPLLEVNNPVLIWSFVDDLTPKLRLDSPYEVRVVSFSKHNGNLIAGGTSSGQVVLWDITGRIEELEKPESLTQNQQMFRKRMEDLMSWRRDVRSKRRVRFTAISSQNDSHLEKISDLAWVTPTTVVTDNLEILKNPSTDSLQLITCSVFGNLHVWDLKTEPGKGDHRKVPQIFKTKERFGRPASLDMGLSPYYKLNRFWKPICKMTIMYKSMPVLLTGFNQAAAALPGKYVRVTPRQPGVKEMLEDRIEYKAVYPEVDDIPHAMYVCNLFGQAGTVVWEPTQAKTPENMDSVMNVYHYWDSYHDRPITRLSKHPFIPSVCLTVGGHVFAIWHIENKPFKNVIIDLIEINVLSD